MIPDRCAHSERAKLMLRHLAQIGVRLNSERIIAVAVDFARRAEARAASGVPFYGTRT